jgi:hypothetical protein
MTTLPGSLPLRLPQCPHPGFGHIHPCHSASPTWIVRGRAASSRCRRRTRPNLFVNVGGLQTGDRRYMANPTLPANPTSSSQYTIDAFQNPDDTAPSPPPPPSPPAPGAEPTFTLRLPAAPATQSAAP